ncbi:MAG: hypothetical protein HUU21_27635 [Polyangiaceae bacterium]|nr:hypothetical protein [Polyangiaceae bacterium]
MRDTERVERALREAERRAISGTATARFPDILGDTLVFTWDEGGPEQAGMKPFEIRLGSRVLWREVLAYECATRFADMAAILARRYGRRARDLSPTPASMVFLLGDSSWTSRLVDAARGRLRAGWQIGG